MDEPKPLREMVEEVKGQGGFYTPAWRAQQGDETDQALHRRAIERHDQALAGAVDGGSGSSADSAHLRALPQNEENRKCQQR